MSTSVNHIINKRKQHQTSTAIRLLLSQKVLRKNLREKHNHIFSVINSDKVRRYFICLQQLVYFKKLKTSFVAIKSLRKRMIMMIKAYRVRIEKTKIVKETAHIYDEHYVKKAKRYFMKRLFKMYIYRNNLFKKRNNIVMIINRKKKKRAIRKWIQFKKHKMKILLLKRRFHLRSLFARWTSHYNTSNNVKYIRYLGRVRILSLMIQHWKKYTLFQIREKIAIHYVQRLERKRVTLTYLHRWVRQHDSNKKTKRELYIMSRTQHHLLRKQFKIWNLVILQRKIQKFKILNKCYQGWIRYVSMRYRKKRITISATRHHQLVRFFKYYYNWSNTTKSCKIFRRNTKRATSHYDTNNLRDALGLLRYKAKRSTRLKVIKRVGYFDSVGLQLGIRVYTNANTSKTNSSMTYTTIDNWIKINKLHEAVLVWQILPRRNKRKKQRKILLAWKKVTKTSKLGRTAMVDRFIAIGKRIRLISSFNTIAFYSKRQKLNRTVIFYITMMKKNNIFNKWKEKAKNKRIIIKSIQRWDHYNVMGHYRYYFKLWRTIVGPASRVTNNVILSHAFDKIKHLFRIRQLMIIATNHEGKKGVRRTFFAWKRYVNNKGALLKTLKREQSFIRMLNIIVARLERLNVKRRFHKWKSISSDTYSSRKTYTATVTSTTNNDDIYDDISVVEVVEDVDYVEDDIMMTPSVNNTSTNTETNVNTTSTATSTKRRYYNTNFSTSINANSKFDVRYRDKVDINTNIIMSQVIPFTHNHTHNHTNTHTNTHTHTNTNTHIHTNQKWKNRVKFLKSATNNNKSIGRTSSSIYHYNNSTNNNNNNSIHNTTSNIFNREPNSTASPKMSVNDLY